MDNWEIYNKLINGMNTDDIVTNYVIGTTWTCVQTENNTGVALTVRECSRPRILKENIIGKKLKDIAQLVKSWNFIDASIGLAAINAYYNKRDFVSSFKGFKTPPLNKKTLDERKEDEAFIAFENEVKGKNICIIGHFPHIEKHYGPICNLTILERNPKNGDYPDSACEYILKDQDFVFVTGMTLINKTLPRILQICKPTTKISIVGPSTPLTDILFDYNVNNLSGYLSVEEDKLIETISQGARFEIFKYGQMVSLDFLQ